MEKQKRQEIARSLSREGIRADKKLAKRVNRTHRRLRQLGLEPPILPIIEPSGSRNASKALLRQQERRARGRWDGVPK